MYLANHCTEMSFIRCRWLRQNVLWFLCGMCTVLWILHFISPFPHPRLEYHGRGFLQRRDRDAGALVNLMASGKFSVIKQKDGVWVEDETVCKTNETFPHAKLHTPTGDVDMAIYPPNDDVWISGYIDREGAWEADLVGVIYKILKQHPSWILIDIGANIGVYTVSMVKAGFEVVAIEPLVQNVKRLCWSVENGKFSGSVRVIHNAVSDSRRKVAFGRFPRNVGGTYVKEPTKTEDLEQLEQTIVLDDLLPMFRNKTVVIKIDVEGHEGSVMRGVEKFFTNVDVRHLLMEFKLGSHDLSSARFVTGFLQKHHMIPVIPTNTVITLDPRDLDKWPSDVMWVKVQTATV